MKQPTRKDYELAAKAAGNTSECMAVTNDGACIAGLQYFWNPLNDDGDSRRLQVACGIRLDVVNCGKDDKEDGFCSASVPGIAISHFVANCETIEEAARFAVFEVAVELGRSAA